MAAKTLNTERDLCKTPYFARLLRQAQISILEIFNIFLRLKFSPSLYSNKIEHFSKVSGNEICLDEKAGIEVVSQIGNLLCRKNANVAIAESCTGGLISHMITNVPGSSDYFLLSCVTYSNEAKINLLGVSPETIRQYGAVHEETAKEMAQGVRRIAGATYGLSTSGIAGPGGATDDKPIGTVCIGLATPKYVKGYRFNFAGNDRLTNKKIFAMKALDLLRTELLEQN